MIQFRGRDTFPEEYLIKLDRVLNALPEGAKQYIQKKDIPIIYLSKEEIHSMPPDLRERIRFAKAITWNKMRINIPEGSDIDSSAILHELSHMAYWDISDKIKDEAKKKALTIGKEIVTFARKRKGIPEDMQMITKFARRRINMFIKSKDIAFAFDLEMILPPLDYPLIAKHLGIDITNEQYITLAVITYLLEENNLRMPYPTEYEEEALAYLVGTDSTFAKKVFQQWENNYSRHLASIKENHLR